MQIKKRPKNYRTYPIEEIRVAIEWLKHNLEVGDVAETTKLGSNGEAYVFLATRLRAAKDKAFI